MEDPLVFNATHEHLFHLCEKGAIRGLRVDHIDGLRDPAGYLNKLQERFAAASPPAESSHPYIIVEKILSREERLPEDWPVSGTTGYEYLNASNGLFVSPSGARELEKVYSHFISKEMSFPDVVYEKKKLVMNTLLRVEMRSLGRHLAELAANDRYARELLRPELADALIEVTACMSVYRTYIRNLDAPECANSLIGRAIKEAKARRPRLSRKCFSFLHDVLTVANPPHILPGQREERLAFVMRWQQFTAPIVAKGVEDTALFVYYPLLSLNEVGGNPEPSMVAGREQFFKFIQERRQRWPDSMNATSTHDTKISEDVRARLNVLSEIPEEWAKEIADWSRENEPHKRQIDGRPVPDADEEYLIYQALVGICPADLSGLCAISQRLQDYAVKATREAMVHTRWTEPNAAHEKVVCNFIKKVLCVDESSSFLDKVGRFLQKISYAGMVNGLSQVLLKITCPGVPDFYQGCELWDRHLVDPDNRGTVDFLERTSALQSLVETAHFETSEIAGELLAQWPNGRIKLYTIWKALNCRRSLPTLFQRGDFIPLSAAGEKSQHIVSFLRRNGEDQAIVAIPRWISGFRDCKNPDACETFWRNTTLHLPPALSNPWRNVFTGKTIGTGDTGHEARIMASQLFAGFPVALLVSVENQ